MLVCTCSTTDEVNTILSLFCVGEALAAEKTKSSVSVVLLFAEMLDGAALC